MKTTLIFLAAVLCAAWPTGAAIDGAPAPSNIGNAEYPRIASDLRVTFRLKASGAKQVKLEGGTGLVKESLEMTRGEDGVWSVTTPPAVPGFHYYWFMVDGLRVNDPSSYAWFGWGRETGGIEVPEAGVDFYAANEKVSHGAVRVHWYHSKITGNGSGLHHNQAAYRRGPCATCP